MKDETSPKDPMTRKGSLLDNCTLLMNFYLMTLLALKITRG